MFGRKGAARVLPKLPSRRELEHDIEEVFTPLHGFKSRTREDPEVLEPLSPAPFRKGAPVVVKTPARRRPLACCCCALVAAAVAGAAYGLTSSSSSSSSSPATYAVSGELEFEHVGLAAAKNHSQVFAAVFADIVGDVVAVAFRDATERRVLLADFVVCAYVYDAPSRDAAAVAKEALDGYRLANFTKAVADADDDLSAFVATALTARAENVFAPTAEPTAAPTKAPTKAPTEAPTAPRATPRPSPAPTPPPPSPGPTLAPTASFLRFAAEHIYCVAATPCDLVWTYRGGACADVRLSGVGAAVVVANAGVHQVTLETMGAYDAALECVDGRAGPAPSSPRSTPRARSTSSTTSRATRRTTWPSAP
jgi:hypothetical protein